MLEGHVPYNPGDYRFQYTGKFIQKQMKLPDKIKRLIKKMLKPKPSSRPSAEKVLKKSTKIIKSLDG